MTLRMLGLALLGYLLLAPTLLVAEKDSQARLPSEEVKLMQSMRYFDGQHWREVWVSDREVAEVTTREDNDSSVLRSLTPGAQLIKHSPEMRIWRLDQTTTAPVITRDLATAGLNNFTPVFHLSNSGGSRLVLTGKLIVAFKQDNDVASITAWADGQGLTFINALSLPKTYLFDAGEGLAALEKAAQIQKSGIAQFAVPDWWREAYLR